MLFCCLEMLQRGKQPAFHHRLTHCGKQPVKLIFPGILIYEIFIHCNSELKYTYPITFNMNDSIFLLVL